MSNHYALLDDVKARMGVTAATDDTILMALIDAASRQIDGCCQRHFYTATGTRYFDGSHNTRMLYVDDFLSLSEVAIDDDEDNDYTDDTWTEGTDWVARPYNGYPKNCIQMIADSGNSILDIKRFLKATGTWGYGNGTSNPWKSSGITGTVATTSGTSLTLSASGTIKTGMTLQLGTEQMFVSAVATTAATVERGVNGTTAATHTTGSISIAQYPSNVSRMAALFAIEAYKTDPMVGMLSESIGDYSYSRMSNITGTLKDLIDRTLGPLKRVTVG